MIIGHAEAARQRFDLCIIGAGPAGIILALETERLRPAATILLVEYGPIGGLQQNPLDDSITVKNLRNHHPPYECTNKGLGGTSATWGGRCVMYDDVDFIDRPVLNGGCTWGPDSLAQALPFIPQAERYFECGSSGFTLPSSAPRIAEGFVEGDVTDSRLERWSAPTRFGKRYSEALRQSRSISLLLEMEARDFRAPGADGRIPSCGLRHTATGARITVSASIFVLAAGAQETTRLLLRNPNLFRRLERPPAALGRYYQSHLSGKISSVHFSGRPQNTDYGFIRESDGVYLRRRFQLTTETLVRENLLSAAFWLDNPLYYDPAHKSGPMSLMYLAMITPFLGKRLAPPAIAQSITKGNVTALGAHLKNILLGLPGSLTVPFTTFLRRYLPARKLPGVFLYNPENTYALHFHAEQTPRYANRMELGADGESLVIHYDFAPEDIDSVIRGHAILDAWLQKCGCGSLKYWFPAAELPERIHQMSRDGIHQSGTTRISRHPRDGVVDPHLKLWGVENLYVCSSSAFPTSSQANPTFFTGVYAARLAAHLSTSP